MSIIVTAIILVAVCWVGWKILDLVDEMFSQRDT